MWYSLACSSPGFRLSLVRLQPATTEIDVFLIFIFSSFSKIAVKESSAASQSNYHSALFCFAHYGVISNAVGPEPSSVSNACIEQATLLSWKSSNGSTARAISGLFKREMRPFRNKHPECFLASQMPEDCRELISEKELSPRPRLPNVSSEVLSENALLETLQQIVAII